MRERIDALIRRCIDKGIVTVGGACRLWIELDPERSRAALEGDGYDPAALDMLRCSDCGRASIGHSGACVWCGAEAS